MPVIYFISADSRIAIRSDPYPSKIIRMNFVLNKLALSVFVDIDAPSLSMMNFTMYNSWIRSCLNLESSYSIIVNVIPLKVTLKNRNRKESIKHELHSD